MIYSIAKGGIKLIDVRAKIIGLMEAKGMTAYALAKKAGVSKSTISRLNNGTKFSPRVDILDDICKALGTNLSDFFLEESKNEEKDIIAAKFTMLSENSKEIILNIFKLLD